jgi:hypothetical protein
MRERDTSIIACSIVEGQAKITLNLFEENGAEFLSVVNNDVVFRIDDVWDFEYAHNMAVVRYGPRKTALRIDLRRPEAIIEGTLWIAGNQIRLGPETTTLPRQNQMSNCTMSGLSVGIQIGEPLIRYGAGLMTT